MKKLIWLIIIIGIIYYGYNNWIPTVNHSTVIKNETEETTNNPTTWIVYENNSYANYSIQYPSDWKMNSDIEQTIFISPDKLDSVVISIKKNNVTNNGIQTIKEIAGQQVLIIEGVDPDDGSPAKFITFTLSNNQKLEMRGFGSIFDKMVNTLILNSEQSPVEREQIDNINTETEKITNEETKEVTKIEDEEEPTIPNDSMMDKKEIINKEEDTEFVIKIFYQNNPGNDCKSVVGLVKQIDTRYNTDEVNALVTLTQSLSIEESAQGYTTTIPYGTRLRSLDIRGKVATADFNSALNEGGGSCMMASRRAQIEQTLLQFPDIEQVIITVDGNAETTLQP